METIRLEMEQQIRLRELELAHTCAHPPQEKEAPMFDFAQNI